MGAVERKEEEKSKKMQKSAIKRPLQAEDARRGGRHK